jgi:PAS domain S-box-containing protein
VNSKTPARSGPRSPPARAGARSRQWILRAYGAAVLVLIGIALTAFISLRDTQRGHERVQHTLMVLDAVEDVFTTILDAEAGFRGYVISGQEVFLEPFHRAVTNLPVESLRLRHLTRDNAPQQARAVRLESIAIGRLDQLRENVETRRVQGFEPAARGMGDGRGKELLNEARAIIIAMEEEESRLFIERERAVHAARLRTLATLAGAGLLVLALVTLAVRATLREFRHRRHAEEELQRANATLEKRVEERTGEWRASEERIREILESTTDGVMVLDAEWRFITLNPSAMDLIGSHGVDVVTLAGKNLWKAFPDLVGSPVERELRRAAEKKVALEFEHYYQPWQKWFFVRAFPMRDRGLSVFFEEISERKKAEREIHARAHQQQTLYQFVDRLNRAQTLDNVYEAALDALCDSLGCDRASILLFDNAGAMRFTAWRGLSTEYRAAVSGHSPWKRNDADARPFGIDDVTKAALDPGLRQAIDAEGIRALAFVPLAYGHQLLGKFMVYFNSPHHFTTDELQLAQALANQLAFGVERKRGEQAAAEQARLLDLSNDAIVVCDLEERILYWNKGAEEIYGWARNDAIGRTHDELLRTEYCPGRAEIMSTLLRTNRWSGELRQQCKDGNTITVHTRWALDRDAQDRPIAILKTENDVTMRKRAEMDLEKARAALQEHAEALERRVSERTAALSETVAHLETFSYSITHDMRGPLRAMTSFAQLLKEEYGEKLDESGHEYLRRIVDSARRLDRLIQDVLQYSRVARGDFPIESVNVDRLVRDIIAQYPDLAQRQQHIHFEGCSPELCVRANLAAMTQIVSNLLNNALKFVPPGREPDVHLHCVAVDDRVRITVEDNGIGIPLEHQHKIFGVFQRLHGQEYTGTGIGLSIVKKAVERMGGTVGLESAPGRGSLFWVELPKATEAIKEPVSVLS